MVLIDVLLVLPPSDCCYSASRVSPGPVYISPSSTHPKPPHPPLPARSPGTLSLLVGSQLRMAGPEVMELGQGRLMSNSGRSGCLVQVYRAFSLGSDRDGRGRQMALN